MWMVPTLHPAFTFRQPILLGPLSAHVEGFLARGLRGFGLKPKLEGNPSVQRLRWFYVQVRKLKLPVAVDIECAPPAGAPPGWALLPGYARLRAFGVAASLGAGGSGLSWEYPPTSSVWALFKEMMRDSSIEKVFCNGDGYDLPVLRRYGVNVAGSVFDIRDARRALSSTSRTGLGFQASVYLTCGPWKADALEDETDEKGFVDPARVPRHKLLRYNAEDCVRTVQIREKHREEFNTGDRDEDRRLRRLYLQQRRLAGVASEMALKGFPIDDKRRQSLARELTALHKERAGVLQKMVRPFVAKGGEFRISDRGGVNENDLRALIFKEAAKPGIKSFELEVPYYKESRTDTGMPAVNKNALLRLWTVDNVPTELLAIIRQCWQVDSPLKARSTYVESDKVLDRIGADGRVHCSPNSCGTETGRWSCRDPNLFNLSEAKDEEAGALQGDLPNIRDMYVAPRGFVIVHADWKQLELEVMAEYTGDAPLRNMIDGAAQKGSDIHTERTRAWFKVPENEPVKKGPRRQAKVVGFCSQYGGGIGMVYLKVLEQIQDAKFSEIQLLHSMFPKFHPGISQHWENSREFAETNGYNETAIMRRRRYYPPGEDILVTETSNYAIQGTAADIANCTMVGAEESNYKNSLIARLHKYFPAAWLAMHVYDSFDIICPKRDAKGVQQLLLDTMPGPWKIGRRLHTLGLDIKVGTRWSEV